MQQIASGFKFAEVTSMHPLNHQPGVDCGGAGRLDRFREE